MMTSRELVWHSIHFKKPERLPFTGSMGETDFSGDTVAIFPDVGSTWWLGGGGLDEWGSFWVVDSGHKDMGQVKNIVLENLENFMSVAVPDTFVAKRYCGWNETLKRAENEGRYVVCCNGPYLFERAHFLHGFENTLMDCIADPELMSKFLHRLAEYHLKTIAYIKSHFQGRVHGYRGTDDWGTQAAPLVSPDIFRNVFKPVYQQIFTEAHEAGMDVWMHSCGQILPLLDDLIECGLDTINLMQPKMLPITELARFRGRICFEICADAQTTLLTGTPDELRKEIRLLLENCCTARGGVIEVKMDRMYFDGDGVTQEYGELCHQEYRSRDPFLKNKNQD